METIITSLVAFLSIVGMLFFVWIFCTPEDKPGKVGEFRKYLITIMYVSDFSTKSQVIFTAIACSFFFAIGWNVMVALMALNFVFGMITKRVIARLKLKCPDKYNFV